MIRSIYASTAVSEHNEENSRFMRMNYDRALSLLKRSKSMTNDRILILEALTNQIFHFYTVQRYIGLISKESKLAYETQICRQNIKCLIERAYKLIYRRNRTIQEQRDLQQLQRIQKMRYDAVLPHRLPFELQQEWRILGNSLENDEKYDKERTEIQQKVQNAMLILFNLRSFLFGTQQQQNLILKLIQELSALSSLLNPRQIETIWEFSCKQTKVFIQAIANYEAQHQLFFMP